jgi:predicted Zn-dependent protease
MTMNKKYFILPILIAALLFTEACSYQSSPVTGQKRLYAYSWQQEVAMGQEADSQIIAYYGLYDDTELANYITKIGKRVLAESHMRQATADAQFRNTEFTFRVLSSPIVNAFALPGGFNYVTRGLLTHMTSEAQLAMVIGHEIGHVAARHASQQALKQQAGSILLIGTAVLGQELLGLPGQDILNLGGTAAQLLFLRYSRDAERESDRLGVEYAAKAGYASAEGAAFFTTLKRLSDKAGATIPSHLSSHPDPGERERDIINRANRWKQQGFAQERVGQRDFYNAISGMILGDNPREGFTRDGIFYHPDMAFQFPYPGDWRLINEPSQVVLVTYDQKAVTIFNLPGKSSAAEAVDEIGNLEQVTVTSRNSININGNNAFRLIGTMQEKNVLYTLHVTAIENQGKVYRFLSYTTQSDYDRYSNAFNQSSGGFSTLTNQSILNIQPARIKIVEVSRSAPFRSFIPNELPMGLDAEGLAIINQVQLDEVIPVGTLLKLY